MDLPTSAAGEPEKQCYEAAATHPTTELYHGYLVLGEHLNRC